MKKDRHTSANAAELRRRAESRLRAATTKDTPGRTEADTLRLVHELRVHQIELEMQNEELLQSRAEAEAGLERYTELYDFAPVGYLILGRDGAIRQINLTGSRFLGVERARLVGGRFGVFVGGPDSAGFKAFLEKVFAIHEKEVCEVALLRDGAGPLNVHITATVSQDGQECRIVMVDITERKRTEEALRASQQIIEGIIDAIPVRVFWKDKDLVYLGCNTAFARDAGFADPKDVIGKDDYQMGWRDQAELYRADDREVIESGCSKLLSEEPQTTPEGNTITLLTSKIPLRSSKGEISGVLGTYMDITERKRAEEEHKKLEAQFRQAQKMEAVGRLSGGVAHDFNNMLAVILGFTELASMKLPADNPVQLYLDEVSSAAKRSADITRQLLAFARKQIIAPKVLNLNDNIASILKMLRRLIGEDIDLLWKPGKDLWPVKMDPAQIDQVLANLMVNARDAIAGVGKITIETGKVEFDEHYCEAHVGFVPGRHVLLAVSDDGCGMDKQTLAKLFEPFFTIKEVGKGTGLGLATIYGIVKQNNGFINVYSEPGQGTTFKIYLPQQEPQEVATEQPRKPAEVLTGTETVLLVEDEKSLLKFAKMLLEELGYTVLAAGSPREAIQLAKEYSNEIHLLMTDVVMPGMSGHDLCEQLEAPRPDLKCLFMSGYTANVIAHQGVLDEGVHFLQKPFSREALAAKIREALS
jgi:PAS domain S-box-containing protein